MSALAFAALSMALMSERLYSATAALWLTTTVAYSRLIFS
jgi:hypothetical protein